MLNGILLVFLSLVIVFIIYKAIYDIFVLSRRDLIRHLKDVGYMEIEVSRPKYSDEGNYFPEKPPGPLDHMKVPIFYTQFYKVKYKDSDGKIYKAVAWVKSRYFKRADIVVKHIN